MLAERPDGVILFLATWIEAPTAVAAVKEMQHLPLAVWGFPMYGPGRGESTGSFVAGAVLKAALERMAIGHIYLAGAVDDEPTLARARAFCQAAAAKRRLGRARIGLVGYASMGMYSGTFDHALLRGMVGPEVDHLDTYTLVRRAEGYREAALRPLVAEIRRRAEVHPAVGEEQLLRAARLQLALRDLATERRWDALTVKCQYELSQEYGMVAWHYLSGESVAYGDLLDLREGLALLSSCGVAPFSLADEARGIRVCDIGYPGFAGLIASVVLRPGTVTVARLAEGRASYRFNYALAEGLPTERRQGRFPALSMRLLGDQQKLLDSLASQHLAIAYGDVSLELEMLCRLLGIEASRA
jgi:L-fucose isomerase-like protein